MFEAPKQEADKYAAEELEKMVPEYLALVDAEKEEEAVLFLKDKFNERPVDILRFAGMVAHVIDDRKKDNAPEVEADADAGTTDTGRAAGAEGEVSGSDDIVE